MHLSRPTAASSGLRSALDVSAVAVGDVLPFGVAHAYHLTTAPLGLLN
jgi:hypothetical protein